jgi:hypothetical protein
MNNHDTDTPAVLDALKESLDGVTLRTPSSRSWQQAPRACTAVSLVVAATAVVAVTASRSA